MSTITENGHAQVVVEGQEYEVFRIRTSRHQDLTERFIRTYPGTATKYTTREQALGDVRAAIERCYHWGRGETLALVLVATCRLVEDGTGEDGANTADSREHLFLIHRGPESGAGKSPFLCASEERLPVP